MCSNNSGNAKLMTMTFGKTIQHTVDKQSSCCFLLFSAFLPCVHADFYFTSFLLKLQRMSTILFSLIQYTGLSPSNHYPRRRFKNRWYFYSGNATLFMVSLLWSSSLLILVLVLQEVPYQQSLARMFWKMKCP